MVSYVYIDGWKANIRFSSAHVIPDYEKCGRLHGHTYAVNARVYGEPDEKGIIIDFSTLKDTLRQTVDELDHKILIPEKNSKVDVEEDKEKVKLNVMGKQYVLPLSDCILLPLGSTSAENLASYVLDKVLEKITFSKRIKSLEIGVDEGFGQGARVTKTFRK